jgi:phosphatidylserine decarboxylase
MKHNSVQAASNGDQPRTNLIEKTADLLGINSYFLRRDHRIRKGRPPIDHPEQVILSPAESKLDTVAEIGKSGLIEGKPVFGKKRKIQLSELWKSPDDLSVFHGGTYLKFYLNITNLHYLLFPFSGRVIADSYKRGKVLPLLFMDTADVENDRLMTMVETDYGFPVGIIMIGSFMVSAIRKDYSIDKQYKRGDQFGYFKIGSSVVLLFPPDSISLKSRQDDYLKLGEPIAEFRSAELLSSK